MLQKKSVTLNCAESIGLHNYAFLRILYARKILLGNNIYSFAQLRQTTPNAVRYDI